MGRARGRARGRGEAAGLVPGERPAPGRGPVSRAPLPRELRRHRLRAAHRGRRHARDRASRPTAASSSTPGRASTCRRSPNCAAATTARSSANSSAPTPARCSPPAGRCPSASSPRGATARRTSTASSSGRRTSIRRRSIPVIEEIYAGPHGAFVPKDFGRCSRQHALAELGFIVVQIDGMGTNRRGKAFHDVAGRTCRTPASPTASPGCKAAAATRPWMDLSRVGIYGGSAGGQNAHARAARPRRLLQGRRRRLRLPRQPHGQDLVERAVDGLARGRILRRASNVVDAHKLHGKLMLIVGELDSNVDPASTMQVVDALQKGGQGLRVARHAGREPRRRGDALREPAAHGFLRPPPAAVMRER